MTMLTVAITQMASENDWTKNSDKAERLVREAAAKGATLILLQELFDGDYFCIEQHAKFLKQAKELDRHPTVKRFAALAKELGVVLPTEAAADGGGLAAISYQLKEAWALDLLKRLPAKREASQ